MRIPLPFRIIMPGSVRLVLHNDVILIEILEAERTHGCHGILVPNVKNLLNLFFNRGHSPSLF